MKDAQVKKLFKILGEIVIQQGICEMSGTDWSERILNDLEDLKKSILKNPTKFDKIKRLNQKFRDDE
jgi:hypothetical protein